MNLQPPGYEPDELTGLLYPASFPKKEVGGDGFEPSKQFAADLQSVPFGHSGIHPYIQLKADDRNRTDNLLITNQLLCQLSHIGTLEHRTFRQTTQNGLEPMTSAVTGRRSNQLSHWALLYYLFLQNRIRTNQTSILATTG